MSKQLIQKLILAEYRFAQVSSRLQTVPAMKQKTFNKEPGKNKQTTPTVSQKPAFLLSHSSRSLAAS
jgi:hypothetical protein